jgi:hypothetical protein
VNRAVAAACCVPTTPTVHARARYSALVTSWHPGVTYIHKWIWGPWFSLMMTDLCVRGRPYMGEHPSILFGTAALAAWEKVR